MAFTIDSISDFHNYLSQVGGVSKHAITNYISWIKFLSNNHNINKIEDEEQIASIIESEQSLQASRDVYNTAKDLVNFKSALRKLKEFQHSDFLKIQENTILSEIEKIKHDKVIQSTEKETIIQARVGQGKFREKLIHYWQGCAVTGCDFFDILVASHIKPWCIANNEERLNEFNGLLLLPNLDKLFDKGYISFDTDGKIIFSSCFPKDDRKTLGLDNNIHLLKLSKEHETFLSYHRDNCLI